MVANGGLRSDGVNGEDPIQERVLYPAHRSPFYGPVFSRIRPAFLHLERIGLQWPLHDFAAVAVVDHHERSNPASWYITPLGIYIHMLRKALIHNVVHNLWATMAAAIPNIVVG